MKRRHPIRLASLVHALSYPITYIVHRITILKDKHKKIVIIIISSSVLLFGSFMSSIHPSLVPSFAWDAASWGVHGLGLAPIAKHIFDILEIEI